MPIITVNNTLYRQPVKKIKRKNTKCSNNSNQSEEYDEIEDLDSFRSQLKSTGMKRNSTDTNMHTQYSSNEHVDRLVQISQNQGQRRSFLSNWESGELYNVNNGNIMNNTYNSESGSNHSSISPPNLSNSPNKRNLNYIQNFNSNLNNNNVNNINNVQKGNNFLQDNRKRSSYDYGNGNMNNMKLHLTGNNCFNMGNSKNMISMNMNNSNIRPITSNRNNFVQFNSTNNNNMNIMPHINQLNFNNNLLNDDNYLLENTLALLRDQNGCRILQKKIEEKNFEFILPFYNIILVHVCDIVNDQFGNYVVQKLLEQVYLHKNILESFFVKVIIKFF
jgi:hypothetical protein